jgi:hypothetical protein
MKHFLRVVLIIGAMGLFLSACATTKEKPLGPDELRLIGVRVPDVMTENVSYDADVTFEAKGYPKIKKVCFRLFAQRLSNPAASLTCFSNEVQANQQVFATCSPWEGPYSGVSPAACSNVEDVKFGEQNRFLAKISSDLLKRDYNKLECHVVYMSNGELKESNRVSAPVKIER